MSERPGFTDECVEAPEAGIKERYQTAGSRRADSGGVGGPGSGGCSRDVWRRGE